MNLFCPDCGRLIAANDIDLTRLLAKCQSCNSVFSFTGAVEGERERAYRRVPADEAAVAPPRPQRMKVDDWGGDFSVSWRWFTIATVGMTFFCIVWDCFLIFWYSIAFRHHGPWIMIVFPICHVGIGIGLTYNVLCGYFNRTKISLTPSELLVRHGPLPWLGNRRLPTDKITQLYCQESFSRNQRSYRRQFQLNASLSDGTTISLVKGLLFPEEAKFLEYTLEQKLAIPPQRVPGEYRD